MNGWFNYRTGEMEYIDTPTDFSDYMPQGVPYQMLYKLYQEHEGLDPIHAFTKVMEKFVGVKAASHSVSSTEKLDGATCPTHGLKLVDGYCPSLTCVYSPPRTQIMRTVESST